MASLYQHSCKLSFTVMAAWRIQTCPPLRSIRPSC